MIGVQQKVIIILNSFPVIQEKVYIDISKILSISAALPSFSNVMDRLFVDFSISFIRIWA